MSPNTITPFDFETLRRALETRDVAGQLAFFAGDAELVCVDADHPPSRPRRLTGRAAIGEELSEVAARDLTHEVVSSVVSRDGAAYTLHCRYPDGSQVVCAAVLELRDGQIVRQEGVQAWDAA